MDETRGLQGLLIRLNSPWGDRLAAGWPGALLLLLLCAAVYLPGLASIPPVDRDESRFAQASRQMFESVALDPADRTEQLHSGGLVVPYLGDTPRLNKPPMIYWLQAASAWVFTGGDPGDDAIWMYRLPSALGAAAGVLLTWVVGRSMFGPRAGLLAAVMLAVCPLVVWDAHQARADEILLATTSLAMWMLWLIWRDRRTERAGWVRALVLWIAVTVGVLTKGPITPMVLGLSALALSWSAREWRWLARTRPWLGLVLVVLGVGPWVIGLARRFDFGTYLGILVDETIGRSASAKEGHAGPPGYHTVLLAVLFWPGSLLTAIGFIRTLRLALRLSPRGEVGGGRGLVARFLAWLGSLPARWRGRVLGRDAELFLVCWILPSWLVFELIGTKLPHYTLPLYPAVAIISAHTVLVGATGTLDALSAGSARIGFGIWLVIGAVVAIALPIGAAMMGAGAVGILGAALGAGVSAWLLLRARASLDEGRLLDAQVRAIGAAGLTWVVLMGLVLPRARTLFVTPKIMAVVDSLDDPGRPLATIGYHEDSLVYATRARVERIGPDEAARWLSSHRRGVLVAPAGTGAVVLGARVLRSVKGLNYAAGRVELLEVLEAGR